MRSQTLRMIVVILLALSTSRAQEIRQDVRVLTAGQFIEREIAGGQVHSYQIQMATAQFLDVVVDQRGIDVVVTLFGPDGKKLSEVDSTNGAFGPEVVLAISEADGEYRVEVRPLEANAVAGKYEVRIEELEAAREEDKIRISTLAAVREARKEAEQLQDKGGTESFRSAIEKYEKALTLWRRIGDKYWEAYSLHDIGEVYEDLGEKQKALEFYNQALALRRSIKDRRDEATTLNSLGLVYESLGQKQKALDFYNQALTLRRAVEDHRGEAATLYNVGAVYSALGEKQKALDFFNQALPLYRAAADRRGEAQTLNGIGVVYDDLGEKQKALDFYNQALPLRRAVGDRNGEATTLYNVGGVYSSLGEKQKALEFYNQALSIYRTVKDGGGEAKTLNGIGVVYDDLGEKQKALDFYNQALPLRRAIGDRGGEAKTLNNIGHVYNSLGQKGKAVEFYNQALPICRALGDRGAEAKTLNNIGGVYSDLGDKQKALEFFNQAQPIYKALGDGPGEVSTVNYIGNVYAGRDETKEALDFYNQALDISRRVRDRSGEASALNNLGVVYNSLGEKQKALEFFNQALPIFREVRDRRNEAVTLSGMGLVYDSLGEKQKALDFYNQALTIDRAVANLHGEATVLNNIGLVYYSLGENQKALSFYNQALPILRAIGDRRVEATTLNNIGGAYDFLGEKQKALEFYNQSLPLSRAVGDRGLEATTLGNIGGAYSDLGDAPKALEFYKQSLPLIREAGDRSVEAITLGNIGVAYANLGEKHKALEFYNQELPIDRAVGNLSSEASTLHNLMILWKSDNTSLAIFFGKQAVNALQQLRTNIKGLEKGLQRTFLSSKERAYRTLASLLISEGRLSEAQQVLGLLKDEEYFEFVRRDADAAALTGARISFTPSEAELEKRFSEIATRIAEIGTQRSTLLALKRRTPEQEKLLSQLEAQLETANQAFQKFLDQLEAELKRTPRGTTDVGVVRESQAFKDTLRELDAVSLYTIVGQDKYNVILITPDAEKAYEYKIGEADLNKKIFAFREVLQNPNSDPLPQAQELYRILIGPELAHDIAQAKKQTILWSLDGTLRYLPMAALHDGQKYLVENYRSIVITLASRDHLKDPVSPKWQALGLGVSSGQTVNTGLNTSLTFAPLPGVREELSDIVRDETRGAGQKGILPGKVMLDDDFTADAMKIALRLRANEQPYKLVHIASHFNFEPGDETKSFLLLGGGKILTLSQLKSMSQVFSRVELLTLSACNTANGGAGEGKEVEGFAVLAQRQGAEAIIATLWPVSDPSTSQLMRRFYGLRAGHPDISKAEAMRQAQLTLLRGAEPGHKADPNTLFAHPYYWAPFIMIGNSR